MENCLKDENVQDQILNERINAQKKYKISSTQQLLSMKKNMKENIILISLRKKLKNYFKYEI